MKMSFLVVAFGLLFSLTQATNVVTLTQRNFQEKVNDEEIMLVEFYAPWCGHCQALEPEYKKAADKLESTGIKLGAVDATQHSGLGSKYDVGGYPTIKLFRRGTAVKSYDGGRTASEIVSYMKREAARSEAEIQKEIDNAPPAPPPNHYEAESDGYEGDEGYGDDYYGEDDDYYGDRDEDYPDEETAEPTGFVNLDVYTFNKIHAKYDLVVKFDEEYPYGEKEKQFAGLTELVAKLPLEEGRDFLVGVVSISSGEETRETNKFLENFPGVTKKDNLPIYKYFKRGSPLSEQATYSGPINVPSLSSWIKSVSNLWIPLEGCIKRFDVLAAKYLSSTVEERNDMKTALTKEVNDSELMSNNEEIKDSEAEEYAKEATAGQYYLKVMKKLDDKGYDYVASERSRIEKLLESGSLSDNKKAEMADRINILSSFKKE